VHLDRLTRRVPALGPPLQRRPPFPPLNTLFLASRTETALTGAVNAVRERLLTRLPA
jgi:hypothetical protein